MKTSQNKMVDYHLNNNRYLDPITALKEYGILRLAARISDLRNEGKNIKTIMVTHQGKRFAIYEKV